MHEFETAWNEASWLKATEDSQAEGNTEFPRIRPGVFGTLKAYLHYLDESGDDRQYFMEDVDLSRLSMQQYRKFRSELAGLRGKIGQKNYSEEHVYNNRDDILGNIKLKIAGTITSNEKGWIFQGSVTADFDTYNFNKASRTFLAELATSIGRNVGELLGAKEFRIFITGEAQISETGIW
jgi:hypothetical protein